MVAPIDPDTALLTEHFGYPPVSLLDDIINSVNILAERALNSVEQGLLAQNPASLGFRPQAPPQPSKSRSRAPKDAAQTPEEAARLEIENGTHQLETLLCASIDRNFDKFELWVMQNVMRVRPDESRDWIRLAHYDGLDLSTPGTAAGDAGDDDAPTPDSLRRLRRRLQASQRLNALLHAEHARTAALLAALRAALAPLAFLRDSGGLDAGDAARPLETTTAFALSQLQALRSLAASLRAALPDLAAGGDQRQGSEEGEEGGRKGGGKSWRRKRMEYVETAARRHLETARGLELGAQGEVVDGEWQGGGPSLGKEEVENLERVVAILGSASGSGAAEKEAGEAMDES